MRLLSKEAQRKRLHSAGFLNFYDIQPDTVLGITKLFPELQSVSLAGMASPFVPFSWDDSDTRTVSYSMFSSSAEQISMPRLQEVSSKSFCHTIVHVMC